MSLNKRKTLDTLDIIDNEDIEPGLYPNITGVGEQTQDLKMGNFKIDNTKQIIITNQGTGSNPIITSNKINHWAFGFVLTLFGVIAWPLAFLGFAFAYIKELHDWKEKGKFDFEDWLATITGAVCGVIMLYGVMQ